MSLRDLVDRKSTIEYETGSFEVRGLSLEDLVLLLDNHKDALVTIFGASDGADFQELVRRFPEFIAAAIAYAADEHDLESQVRKLPVGVQLRAIQEVWELSSLDVETVGKLANSVLRGIAELNASDPNMLRENLKNGLESSRKAQSI